MINDAAKLLQEFATFCAAQEVSAWLVGGAARDLALGRVSQDLDVVTTADGLALSAAFANATAGTLVILDKERGAARIVWKNLAPGKPFQLDLLPLQAPTLEEDLFLRDFTINALALPLPLTDLPLFIDPCNGLADLKAQKLRPCNPKIFQADPGRILRSMRFGAELGLELTPELVAMTKRDAALLNTVAGERLRDELLKILAHPHAASWLRYMDEVGVLTQLFPELEPARNCDQPRIHFLPVLAHLLEAVACLEWLLEGLGNSAEKLKDQQIPVAAQTFPNLPRDLPFAAEFQEHFANLEFQGALLKLAVLLHDNSKPQTKKFKEDGGVAFHGHQDIGAKVALAIAQRLRLSRQQAQYVALIVENHMRPGQLRTDTLAKPRALARFFRDLGIAAPAVLLHGLADHLATRGPNLDLADWQQNLTWTSALLQDYWHKPPIGTPNNPHLLKGDDLMIAFKLAPGKIIGQILHEVHEAQAAGEISTREEALALAQQVLQSLDKP